MTTYPVSSEKSSHGKDRRGPGARLDDDDDDAGIEDADEDEENYAASGRRKPSQHQGSSLIFEMKMSDF